MKSIVYLIPYFGRLPKGFDLWLISAGANPSIDWILFTDDHTGYNYPNNVKVVYQTYESFVGRIKEHFDFSICIDRPWKLCEFRPAYGEIFADELEGYDYWGHCDLDLLWGNIRSFITDDILSRYEKIGFQGHSTLYKNTPEVNGRYKTVVPDAGINYRDYFSSAEGHCFDEVGMCSIYDYLELPYYRETNFAHLDRFHSSFFLGHLPISEDYKNDRQVIVWDNGHVYRYYLTDGEVERDEFMYIHFFSRPIKYKNTTALPDHCYVARPDVIEDLCGPITAEYLSRYGKCPTILFYMRVAIANRHKLTLRKIIQSFQIKARNEKTRANSKVAVKASIEGNDAK